MRTAFITPFMVALGFVATAIFAQPIVISPEGQKAGAPDVAINAKGQLAILWVDRSPQDNASAGHDHNHDRHLSTADLYVTISPDGGKTFNAPVKVNSAEGVVWGQQLSRPRIVGTPNGTWHVSYAANDIHPTLKKTLLTTHYTRSVDGGNSFEKPQRLSGITDQDMSDVIHGGFASAAAFGTMTAAPDGGVHVYWVDTRHMKPDSDSGALYGTSSRDDGKTFASEKQLIDTSVCPCCQLTAITTENSDVLIGSRRVEKDSFRPATVMKLSNISGAASERKSIGGAPWQIGGCPLKPTVIATHGQKVFAAVHNGGETTPGVIFSVSNDAGNSFDFRGIVHTAAAVSDAPSVAVNDEKVLLAWHAKVGNAPRRVFYRFYSLSGKPIGDITELGSAAGVSQYPIVTVKKDGDFQIVWQQGDKVWTTEIAGK
jgi:hypothetical protein